MLEKAIKIRQSTTKIKYTQDKKDYYANSSTEYQNMIEFRKYNLMFLAILNVTISVIWRLVYLYKKTQKMIYKLDIATMVLVTFIVTIILFIFMLSKKEQYLDSKTKILNKNSKFVDVSIIVNRYKNTLSFIYANEIKVYEFDRYVTCNDRKKKKLLIFKNLRGCIDVIAISKDNEHFELINEVIRQLDENFQSKENQKVLKKLKAYRIVNEILLCSFLLMITFCISLL